MLTRLLRRFQPVVLIDAEGDEMIFRCEATEIRRLPVMRVAANGRIIAVGQPALQEQPGRLFRVFEDTEDGRMALRAFCYNLMHVVAKGKIVRPRVLIRESALRRAFGKFAADWIRESLQSDHFVVDYVLAA